MVNLGRPISDRPGGPQESGAPADIWCVSTPSRLEPAALDTVLDSLLASNPNAPIVAINETGFFVPMPRSVPLSGQRVIEGHATALELVVAEDMTAIIEAWTIARHTGAAQTTVHLSSNPDQAVTLRYVDAMHRHGVYIGMFEMVGSEEIMAAFQEAATVRPKVALIRKNELAFILQIDSATSEILGWSSEEMVGRRTLEFIDPEDHQRAISSWMDMLRIPGSRRRVRLRHRHRDGSWVWFEITNHNLLNDPAHGCILTEMLDVSEEMAAQDALREREHLLRRLTEALPLGIFQVDTERRIVYRNARLASIVGRADAATVEKQLAAVIPDDRQPLEAALDAVLIDGRDRDVEIGVRRNRRDVRRCTLNLRALTDEAGTVTGAIACVADVTENVRMREELEHRATYDVLTRCLNRASILGALDRALSHQRSAVGTGVVFVDLDHFKVLNDRLGHAAGDALLVEVAKRLMTSVRGHDVVGRLGGDEFLVVCAEVESADRALQIAERIADALAAHTVDLGDEQVMARASIGVAWSAGEQIDADFLVARADQAMYESKRQRLGRPVLETLPPDVEQAA